MLRQQMHAITQDSPELRLGEDSIGLPEYVAGPLGLAGLPRGGIVESTGPVVLLVGMLAHMLAEGLYIAVVGWPNLSLAQLAVRGGDLSKVVVVPDPGEDPFQVVAVLLEGMDVVVYRPTARSIPPAVARPLLAKMRRGPGTLIVQGATVAAAGHRRTTVSGRIVSYRGCSAGGVGRIAAIDMDVQVVRGGRVHQGLVTLCGP